MERLFLFIACGFLFFQCSFATNGKEIPRLSLFLFICPISHTIQGKE